MNEEIWKPIIIEKNEVLYDFTGKYEVSNYGRVRSLNYAKSREIKVLKPHEHKGYLHIGLYKNGKEIKFQVHRLVAYCFIPNPQNLETVNHKDYNRANNSVDNLEWISREDNAREAQKGKSKPQSEEHRRKNSEAKKGSKNPSATKVLCVETGMVFNCIKDASIWLGIKHTKGYSNISSCCRGKSKTAYGYHWKYAD